MFDTIANSDASRELTKAAHRMIDDSSGRCRAEDMISALAAFLGECVLRQAGDFDFDDHAFVPGKPIFSTKVNEILSGDRSDWLEIPITSIFGGARHILRNNKFYTWPADCFPDIGKLYQGFAMARARGASKQQWGKAPLSVPAANYPREQMPPLRAAFELRQSIGQRCLDCGISPEVLMTSAHVCLVVTLMNVRTVIAPSIAITLAFETINAMSKTAPMLQKHMLKRAAPAMLH